MKIFLWPVYSPQGPEINCLIFTIKTGDGIAEMLSTLEFHGLKTKSIINIIFVLAVLKLITEFSNVILKSGSCHEYVGSRNG